MANGTGVFKGMAGKTGPQLKRGQVGMGPSLEQCERYVASWKLVMTSRTTVSRVTNGAGLTVQRRIPSVDGISPACGVRQGSHHLMTSNAISAAVKGRRNIGMTNKALGISCRCLVLVVSAKTFRVREGLQVPGVADRRHSALGVDVAGLAVGHFEM